MEAFSSIFNNSFFRVPDYQRGYSWEESQLNDFWKDLTWLRNGHVHYTGTFTLFPLIPRPKTFPVMAPHNVYHLVDGQQRLTTSFLLLSKLIGRTGNRVIAGQPVDIVKNTYLFATISGTEYPVFGYDSKEKMVFLLNLLSQRSTVKAPLGAVPTKNVYEKNLLAASDFFDKKLNNADQGIIDNLFILLTNQLVFDVHKVSNTFDVCAMFESINYRGKKPTKFEVLKNRLMYLSEQLVVADPTSSAYVLTLRKDIESAWGSAFNWFGSGEKPLDEDVFLHQHTIMYFGALPHEPEALDKILFKKYFSIDRIKKIDDLPIPLEAESSTPITLPEIKRYVENIKKSSELWTFQNSCINTISGNPNWVTPDVVAWMLRLNRLGIGYFEPLLLGALNIISLPGTQENSNTFLLLLKRIERFNFILFGLCDFKSNKGKSEFSGYGKGIYYAKQNYSFNEVCLSVNDYVYLQNIDGEYDGAFNPDLFIRAVLARFIENKGWFKWPEIKYLLSEWEANFKGSPNIMSIKEYHNASIEHIMPRNLNPPPGQWMSNRKTLGRRFEFVVHDLGNLTLLGIGANTALQDNCLAIKKNAYSQSYDGLDIFQRAGTNLKWEEAEILDRGRDMVNFICKRWEVPCEDILADEVLSTNIKHHRKR